VSDFAKLFAAGCFVMVAIPTVGLIESGGWWTVAGCALGIFVAAPLLIVVVSDI